VVKWKADPGGDISGFLDRGVSMKGEISFKETFRIDGKFEGIIRSSKSLVVGEFADVNAEIEVERIFVAGSLRGSVNASDRIEIQSTAHVQSDLTTKVLVVDEGAVFEGRCTMSARSGPRTIDERTVKLKEAISSK
jgi:cytoskeletal protein CcmA (bactofilin family)